MSARATSLRRSIRTRIAAVFALAALLPTLVLGVLVDRVAMDSGLDQLRARATTELTAARATRLFAGDVTTPGISLALDAAPEQLLRDVRADGPATYFDGRTMWAAGPVTDGLVAVEVSAEPLLDQRLAIRRALGAAGALLTLVMTALGWVLADGLTRRLRRAAREVEDDEVATAPGGVRRGPGLLHVAPDDPGDEVSELVERINHLTLDLRRRLQVEREFSATVAHELRTPLTGLVSATELLPAGPATDRVRRQTQRLRTLVEELIDLARADQSAGGAPDRVDLGDVVDDLAARFPDVEVVREAPGTVRADRRVVEQILTNLLRNAEQHGAGPVTLSVRGCRLEVSDHGPGLPPDLVRHGPSRFAPIGTTGGTGLGLALVAAWADALGAELVLDNRSEGGSTRGARVSVTLPPAMAPVASTPA